MHYLFAGTSYWRILLAIFLKVLPHFSRISLNLWNSAVAIITAGTLFRGIVNLSGRSTTLDAPYWYVGIGFAILAIVTIFINQIFGRILLKATKTDRKEVLWSGIIL